METKTIYDRMRPPIAQMSNLWRSKQLDGGQCERLMREALEAAYPYRVLHGIHLFRPELADSSAYGNEIDHIMHYQSDAIDHVVIIETKSAPIEINQGKWLAFSGNQRRDVQKQILSQAATVRAYLSPLSPSTELRICCIAVSASGDTVSMHLPMADGTTDLYLTTASQLAKLLCSIFPTDKATCLRVVQSDFLGILRMGQPISVLGHPELGNAIQYIKRCRRSLDSSLYQSFRPTTSRWAINGSAGMGKSVLLAYSAAVLASDHEIGKDRQLLKWGRREQVQIVSHRERRLCIIALKAKQLDVLEKLYGDFVSRFQSLESAHDDVRFLKPRFQLWHELGGRIPEDTNVLIIDEAHDLTDQAQRAIAEWYKENQNHYLIIACDRHQKLRTLGRESRMLVGVDFTGCTHRLKRNYRNPIPVFVAALALMFRWFSNSGPRILPTSREIKDFGLVVATRDSEQWVLEARDDAHPANVWQHTIEIFTHSMAAFEHLQRQQLPKDEVLWVRLNSEDPTFDYERLSIFTYHNFHTPEGAELIDKYVKGQDYGVVVIEGLPPAIDDYGHAKQVGRLIGDAEEQMWCLRKAVYLCCSRATGFLYFIRPTVSGKAGKRISHEISTLVKTLSETTGPRDGSGQRWSLKLPASRGEMDRSLIDFVDIVEPIEARETEHAANTGNPTSLATERATRLKEPVILRYLAVMFDEKPYKLIKELIGDKECFSENEELPRRTVERLCERRGVKISWHGK